MLGPEVLGLGSRFRQMMRRSARHRAAFLMMMMWTKTKDDEDQPDGPAVGVRAGRKLANQSKLVAANLC
jgi:hypothetical protein